MKRMCATCPFRLKEPRKDILERLFVDGGVSGWTPGECHELDKPCGGMTDEEVKLWTLKIGEVTS